MPICTGQIRWGYNVDAGQFIQGATSGLNWVVTGALASVLALFLKDFLEKPADRANLDSYLASRRWTTIYRDYLCRTLDRVDGLLKPQIARSQDVTQYESRQAWSWPLMDLTLRCALVYPLLTLIVSWAVTGADGRIGSFVVLPTESAGARASVLVLLVLLSWYLFSDYP